MAFDPISKASKFKSANFGADIALISLNHPDMNGVEQVNRGEKEAFIVNGPGEYEIQGVFIKGLPSVSNYSSTSSGQAEEKINTIYTVNFENMNLCFLGALGSAEIPSETKAGIDGVDILFVPVGGPSASSGSATGVLDAAAAYKFAVSLEPSIMIPMNYDDKSLKAFLKEGGADNVKPIEKLTVKKKDLEGKAAEIVVLESQ